MKKIFYLLFATLILTGCSLDDDGTTGNYIFLPITDNDLPEEFIFNKTYDVEVTYELENDCQEFINVRAQTGGTSSGEMTEIYVAVNAFEETGNCSPLNSENTTKFTLTASQLGTYTFNFLIGVNSANEPMYQTVSVPVVDGVEE